MIFNSKYEEIYYIMNEADELPCMIFIHGCGIGFQNILSYPVTIYFR